MLRTLRRIGTDILSGRNIESYALSIVALVIAVLSFIEDALSIEVQLAVILAALALLVFRTTAPEKPQVDLDNVLRDRQSYGPLRDFVRGGSEMCIYGPSAVNLLTSAGVLEREILDRGGKLRVLIQDPSEAASINMLYRQLDEMSTMLTDDIQRASAILENLKERRNYDLEYRLLPYSPGFSIVIIDPDGRDGRLVIEFFGYSNRSIEDRMHIEIQRRQSNYWFEYWASQFERMWDDAKEPEGKPHG